MNFKDHYAFVTGWTGVQVLDIARPDSPQLAAELPLAHFENEDVDLCGNTLIVVNDREAKDPGSWFGSPTRDSTAFQPHPVFGFMCPVLQPDVDVPS
jgi:hypothetical protein